MEFITLMHSSDINITKICQFKQALKNSGGMIHEGTAEHISYFSVFMFCLLTDVQHTIPIK